MSEKKDIAVIGFRVSSKKLEKFDAIAKLLKIDRSSLLRFMVDLACIKGAKKIEYSMKEINR